ncbi:hypothetical protein [Bdellovibrio sp. HCB337]|uniref:hypothetical protein n=1 Tax=Bdellovibrio sp. HCB337 TaxID=3394358 RepID=UPI0039A5D684
MPNVYYRTVVLSWSAGRRRHQAGGANELEVITLENVAPGSHCAVPVPGKTIEWPTGTTKGTGTFAYMTVSGAASGNVLYTTDDQARRKVVTPPTVGETDVNIVMIYLPTGGVGVGPNAVYVDAFNVSTGQFMDQDFVKVMVGGTLNSQLTTSVNKDGIVVSDNVNNEHVLAVPDIEGRKFVKWQLINGYSETVQEEDLGIANGQTAFYLAIYETPKSISLGKPTDQYAIWRWVDKGTMVDGGPHPWDPMIAEWQTGIAMAAQAKFANSKFQKQILELASQQVLMASETLSKTILSTTKEMDAKKKASGM